MSAQQTKDDYFGCCVKLLQLRFLTLSSQDMFEYRDSWLQNHLRIFTNHGDIESTQCYNFAQKFKQ